MQPISETTNAPSPEFDDRERIDRSHPPAIQANAAGQNANVSEASHQPTSFSFPGRPFGKETFSRSFNAKRFNKWRWVHYIEDGDHFVCFSCVKVVEKGLINEDCIRLDSSFVKGGFTNGWKATEKFNGHEKSKLHSDAIQKISALENTLINALLSDAAHQAQSRARHVLELMFRSVLFLVKKGVAFWGDSNRDGILYDLMLGHTYNLPKVRELILRRDNWLLDTIQNEVI